MNASPQMFFGSLFSASQEVIEWLPLTTEPATMAYVEKTLQPAVEASRQRNPFVGPTAADRAVSSTTTAIGLNTVGMLLDRLSIIAMKHWNLRFRAGRPAAADELMATQVKELIEALAQAQPGYSSVNNKLTTRKVDVRIEQFSDAYFGLLTTNVLLWESQEILYNHDISKLPCEELRAYIDFFSRGNLMRNEYIQASDELYWLDARPEIFAARAP